MNALERALAGDAPATELLKLGGHFNAIGNFELAHECFSRAHRRDQADPEIRRALGLSLCRRGEVQAGLELYESRWALEKMRPNLRPYKHPYWHGEPVAGKHILLWGEQGIGDQILAARCIPRLLDLGAQISVECDARLHPLLTRSYPGIACFQRHAKGHAALRDAAFAYQSSMLSAWRWLPAVTAQSYLRADPELVSRYRREWSRRGWGHNIGVSWRGGAKSPDKARATPVWLRTALIGTSSTLHAIQYGADDEELSAISSKVGKAVMRDASCDARQDLDRLAALISALDLVVSVGNATAHLAGALGTPAHAIIPLGAMWYWGTREEQSPWYPGSKLIRQAIPGSWEDVSVRLRLTLTSS
jgi:hypothetical protein